MPISVRAVVIYENLLHNCQLSAWGCTLASVAAVVAVVAVAFAAVADTPANSPSHSPPSATPPPVLQTATSL